MKRLLVAAAVTAALAVVNGSAVGGQTTTLPAKLVGTWTRTVTQADVTKSGGSGISGGSSWILIMKKSGAAVAGTPTTGGFTGKIVPAGAGRVHVNIGTPVTNVYTWRVSGRALTFTKVKDSEPDRVAVLAGVWKRK